MPVGPGQDGFGLIEALVATTVLAAACLGLAGVVVTSLRAEQVAATRTACEAALHAERARLSTLPYCLGVAATSEASMALNAPASVLADVFPHAQAGFSTAEGSYAVRDGIGVFTSERLRGTVLVRREARFLRPLGMTRTEVPASGLEGWDIAELDDPPAAFVQVALSATFNGATSSLVVRIGALPPALAGSTP